MTGLVRRTRAPSVRRLAGAIALACVVATASAQYAIIDRADWQEDAPPPAPAYDAARLIEIEMPRTSSIKLGIDPKTITVNVQTGVARYVVVARGPSAVNASYEGIRCATGQYRVYARKVQDGPWQDESDSKWKDMRGQHQVMVRYPFQLARNGICDGTTVRSSVREIVHLLETNNEDLYR